MSAIIRRVSTAAVGFLFLTFLNESNIPAQPLLRMNVQGVLMDINGKPIDGTFSMKFSIYESQSGGSAIWTETHADVPVSDGLFNVYLGITNPFAVNPSIFGQYSNLYLGIAVGEEPEFERVMLSTVPYSFYASEADKANKCTTLLGAANDLKCTGCAGSVDIASNSINSSHIINGTIKDDDISTTAQINFTKLSGVAALNHTHSEYAPLTHDHNDLYYTETEIDTFLLGKSNVGHNHDDDYFTKGELNNPGAINSPENPIDWSRLKNVPAGIAESKPFGDWISININQVYQAASDGFAVGFSCYNGDYVLQGLTDANDPPTTVRIKQAVNSGAGSGDNCASINMPVKKGNYYKITADFTSSSSFYFLPLGW